MTNLQSFRGTVSGDKGLGVERTVSGSNQVGNYLDLFISYLNLLLAYSFQLEVVLVA